MFACTRANAPRYAATAREVATFRAAALREACLGRLRDAMGRLGLELDRGHFAKCTVAEIQEVTARYNRHNKVRVHAPRAVPLQQQLRRRIVIHTHAHRRARA